MARLILLMSLAALATGCNLNGSSQPKVSSPGKNQRVTVAPKVRLTVPPPLRRTELPKLLPIAKFRLPGRHSGLAGLGAALVQLSDDGGCFATTYRTPKLHHFAQVWQVSPKPMLIAEFAGDRFALSPQGKFILTPSYSKMTQVFNVKTKNVIAKLPVRLFSHAFFRNEHTVVCTDRSFNFQTHTKGRITVWNLNANADAGSFDIEDNRFFHAFSARNRNEIWLLMGNNKNQLECYDLDKRKQIHALKTKPPRNGLYPSVCPDEAVFASAPNLKTRIFDGKTGEVVGLLPPYLYGMTDGLMPGGSRYLIWNAGSPSEERVAIRSGFKINDIIVYDWKQQKGLAVLTGHSADHSSPNVGISGDGLTVASVTDQGEVLVFDLRSLE